MGSGGVFGAGLEGGAVGDEEVGAERGGFLDGEVGEVWGGVAEGGGAEGLFECFPSGRLEEVLMHGFIIA